MVDRSSPYYSVREAAHALGVHKQTIYRMVHDGELRHVVLGRMIRIPAGAIDELEVPRRAAEELDRRAASA